MKFLTISSVKDLFYTLPPNVSRMLLEASLAWMNQKKQEGVVLEMYVAGWNRYAVICQHDSAESLINTLAAIPTAAYMNHDIYPLSDFNEGIKTFIESAKAAEKMMPGPPG